MGAGQLVIGQLVTEKSLWRVDRMFLVTQVELSLSILLTRSLLFQTQVDVDIDDNRI